MQTSYAPYSRAPATLRHLGSCHWRVKKGLPRKGNQRGRGMRVKQASRQRRRDSGRDVSRCPHRALVCVASLLACVLLGTGPVCELLSQHLPRNEMTRPSAFSLSSWEVKDSGHVDKERWQAPYTVFSFPLRQRAGKTTNFIQGTSLDGNDE